MEKLNNGFEYPDAKELKELLSKKTDKELRQELWDTEDLLKDHIEYGLRKYYNLRRKIIREILDNRK